MQLKEKIKARQFKEELSATNSKSSVANKSHNGTIERDKKIKRYAGEDPANVSIISFDVCEISEQITTV